jgi:hypothetical protein
MKIFGERTTTDDRVETPAKTPAEEADREAYEAERAEAAERRDVAVAERPAVHPIVAARERFGGIDLPASLVGMLTALAMVILLGGLVVAAFGEIGYQTGLTGDDINNVNDISLASWIGGVAVLFVSYLIGGWTAGRIARYDGARNGLMTAVWTIVLAAVLSGLAAWLGNEYDVFANRDLPQWFNRDALTTVAIVSGAAGIVAMLFGGLLGGLWGTRYHRLADETLLDAHNPQFTS